MCAIKEPACRIDFRCSLGPAGRKKSSRSVFCRDWIPGCFRCAMEWRSVQLSALIHVQIPYNQIEAVEHRRGVRAFAHRYDPTNVVDCWTVRVAFGSRGWLTVNIHCGQLADHFAAKCLAHNSRTFCFLARRDGTHVGLASRAERPLYPAQCWRTACAGCERVASRNGSCRAVIRVSFLVAGHPTNAATACDADAL